MHSYFVAGHVGVTRCVHGDIGCPDFNFGIGDDDRGVVNQATAIDVDFYHEAIDTRVAERVIQ